MATLYVLDPYYRAMTWLTVLLFQEGSASSFEHKRTPGELRSSEPVAIHPASSVPGPEENCRKRGRR